MTLTFGFGIFTGQTAPGGSAGAEYRNLLELAPRVEQLGFSSIWLSEHHFAGDNYLPSVLPVAAAVAARTESVRIGTALVLAPFHNPIRLAEDAAVVDLLSSGRLILGVGAGWRSEEFRSFKVPTGRRGESLEELVPFLREAWTGEYFSADLGRTTFEDVRVRPAPSRPIPIWLGASSGAGLHRVGRLADGYLSSPRDITEMGNRLAEVDEGARLAGRRPVRNVGLMVDAWVGDVDDDVLLAHWTYRAAYSQWGSGGDTSREPYVLPPMPEGLAPTVHGGPAEVAEALRARVEAVGADRDITIIVKLQYPGLDVDRVTAAAEVFSTAVMPRLHALFPP